MASASERMILEPIVLESIEIEQQKREATHRRRACALSVERAAFGDACKRVEPRGRKASTCPMMCRDDS